MTEVHIENSNTLQVLNASQPNVINITKRYTGNLFRCAPKFPVNSVLGYQMIVSSGQLNDVKSIAKIHIESWI